MALSDPRLFSGGWLHDLSGDSAASGGCCISRSTLEYNVVGADDIPSFLLAAGSLNFPRNRAASFRKSARWPVIDGVEAKVGQYFSSRLKAVRRLSSKTCLHATYSL